MSFDQWLDRLTEAVREKEARKPSEPQCYTCFDTGMMMTMVCYGGPPVERVVYCIDCEQGNGPRGALADEHEAATWKKEMDL